MNSQSAHYEFRTDPDTNTSISHSGIAQMPWLLLNVIGMSVGLGTLLITVFDNWMRGYSIFWWVMLALLTIFSILVNALMLVVQIKRSSAIAPPAAVQES
jgi:hypothetical protein